MDSFQPHDLLLDLASVASPKSRLVSIILGGEFDREIEVADMDQYDFLPVCHGDGRIAGMVEVATLKTLRENGRGVNIEDLVRDAAIVPTTAPLLRVLEAISDKGFAVVADEVVMPISEWFGLITASDVNRHSLRAAIYPVFARLESDLARWIEVTFDDPWTWLPAVPSNTRPSLVGRWELDKREDIETNPIVGCMLTDMLSVVSKLEDLWSQLGYSSEKQCRESIKEFGKLRNAVMHPVRRLIDSREDITILISTIREIQSFAERVSMARELSELHRARLRTDPVA